jgi:hypothetical protein
MKTLNVTIGDAVVIVADAGDLAVVKAPYHTMFTDAKGKKRRGSRHINDGVQEGRR